MLSIPQYHSFFERQYQDVEKETKKVKFVVRFDFQFFTRFLVKRAIRKINFFLPSQLLKAKGVLADLESKEQQLQDRDVSELIGNMQGIINFNIDLHSIINSLAEHFEEIAIDMPDVKTWGAIVEETIEVNYSILRLLKRLNKKTNIETSTLALESSRRSLTSLERVSYDRRAT